MQKVPQAKIKPAAVAGLFYPGEAGLLRREVQGYLGQIAPGQEGMPRALIVPHAGYVYSGPVAANAYRLIQQAAGYIRRVLLIGPSHRVAFSGIAAHSADYFRTPMGEVPLDRGRIQSLLRLPFVHLFDPAFAQEHCLEVQLPFLQGLLEDFKLIPLLIGQSDFSQVAELLESVVDDRACLILISSDLSHYHSYAEARRLDQETSENILALNAAGLEHEHACGRIGIGGLLKVAKRHGWLPQLLDLRNSGDTAGSRDQVVGYGAYAFF